MGSLAINQMHMTYARNELSAGQIKRRFKILQKQFNAEQSKINKKNYGKNQWRKIADSALLEGKISELKMLKRKLIVLSQSSRMIESKLQKLVEDSKKYHGDLTDKDKVKKSKKESDILNLDSELD